MKDELITLETFKLAKEKGFDLKICDCGGFPDCICDQDKIAPTQSLLQRWLREEYFIHASSHCNHSGWFWDIEKTNGTSLVVFELQDNMSGHFNTYEQALEAGLLEALKIVKDYENPIKP